ncbi:MAG: antibiotic biosynthesis monooxygenase [Caldilinea sp. CFX5]|nr:antibiotic biosynthesis monooxygenase [Caldilinea sp. CFX5]
MLIVSVIVTVRADRKDAVLAEFEKVVRFARTQQAGCISFTLSSDVWGTNPQQFHLYEVWESMEPWKAFHQAPAVLAFFAAVNKLGEGALTFTENYHYEATLITV